MRMIENPSGWYPQILLVPPGQVGVYTASCHHAQRHPGHAMSAFLPPSSIGTVVRTVPVILIVILSFPAWLTWPFLSEERRKSVVQMVDALARWVVGDSTGHYEAGNRIAERHLCQLKPDGLRIDLDSRSVVIERRDEVG